MTVFILITVTSWQSVRDQIPDWDWWLWGSRGRKDLLHSCCSHSEAGTNAGKKVECRINKRRSWFFRNFLIDPSKDQTLEWKVANFDIGLFISITRGIDNIFYKIWCMYNLSCHGRSSSTRSTRASAGCDKQVGYVALCLGWALLHSGHFLVFLRNKNLSKMKYFKMHYYWLKVHSKIHSYDTVIPITVS